MLALVLAVGIGIRGVLYFARPSLLLDEVRLSLNIASRSWIELLRPLDYDQTASPLFLWAEKVATRLGGVNEYALRAIPFLASVAVLPLVYHLARRLLKWPAAVLATGVAALSPLFLQYTRQVKPYSIDVVVALCLTIWALDWARSPHSSRCARRLLLGGVVAVWLSASAPFVLIGCAVALACAPPTDRPPARLLLSMAVAWVVSFAPVYWWVDRPAAENSYLQQFWSGSLVSVWKPGAGWRLWHGIREILWQTFVGGTTEPPLKPLDDLLVTMGTLAFLWLALAGVRRLARDAGPVASVLLWAPGLAVVGASLLGQYPLAARLVLFAVPALIILVASGWESILSAGRPERLASKAVLTGACILAPPLPLDASIVGHPTAYEHVRPAVREFERLSVAGEPIYVFAASVPALTFYTTRWSAPDTARLTRMARLASSGGPAFENSAPRGRPIRSEGDSLSYPFRNGRELIGLFHGAQDRHATGMVQQAPDTNWTANEARRIRNAANPTVWVLMSHTYGLERFLGRALDLCVDHLYRGGGVVLARFSRLQLPASQCAGRAVSLDD